MRVEFNTINYNIGKCAQRNIVTFQCLSGFFDLNSARDLQKKKPPETTSRKEFLSRQLNASSLFSTFRVI